MSAMRPSTPENKICCSCCIGSPTVVDEETEGERSPLLHRSGDRHAKKMPKICCPVTSTILAVLFIVVGILFASLFDPFVNTKIDEELVLHNDSSSEVFKFWVDPPIVPYLKIYFFNLTNREDFLLGEKPNFKEVGPYSYSEKWHKVNVSFHDNGTVTYQTRKLYFFDRSKSAGPESDIIHTLNVPVNVAVKIVGKMGRLAQLAFSSMLSVLNETAFVHRNVSDLVWGYKDKLMEVAKKIMPDQQMPFDKFGFFYNRNGSTDGIFNVYTGAGDIRNYTMIDTFNYSKELSYWNTPQCNMVNGTDGTSYPPHLKKSDVLYMFNENLCRSLPLVYNDTVYHYDVKSWRFTPPKDVFADVSVKPENKCFCVGGPPCMGGGVFNISACKFNVSTVLSWPHFYQADEKYSNAVTGLKPDPAKHSLYIDINPTLGMPLSAEARIQINFVTHNLSAVKQVANLTQMVFPVMWFEDGVDSLPPSVVAILDKSIIYPKIAKIAILSISFILGVGFLILAIIFWVPYCKDRRSKLPITRESSDFHRSDSGLSNPGMSTENPD